MHAGPGRYHGWIDYANFAYRAPFAHTNVWNIGRASQLTFTVGGATYKHTMKVDTVTPVSTTTTQFSGAASNDDPTYTWTITGTVSYEHVIVQHPLHRRQQGLQRDRHRRHRARRLGVRG